MKFLKRTLITLFVLIVLLIVSLIAIPLLFKDKIINLAKEEASKTLNAKINFSNDLEISIFKNFPNLTLGVKDLSIINNAPFLGDTLYYASLTEVSLDINSIIGGKQYRINEVLLSNPVINLISNSKGIATWQITKPDTTTKQEQNQPADNKFKALLKSFKITNGRIVYCDSVLKMFTKLKGFNHELSGNFNQEEFLMKTQTNIKELNFAFGGIPYLKNVSVDYKADFDINQKLHKYSLSNNRLKLNELVMLANGSVEMPDTSRMILDLVLKAEKSDFKNFLSLIPAIYSSSFKDLTATGKFGLDAKIKGTKTVKDLPSFSLNLIVENGAFKYPSLPSEVKDVQITCNINNPGGSANNTEIDIPKAHLTLANQPIDASLLAKTLLSDPYVDGEIKGKIDFSQIKNLIPLEKGTTLEGQMDCNINFKGNMSSIKSKQYEKFDFKGFSNFTDINFNSKTQPQAILVKSAELKFSPKEVTLSNCNVKLGQSDISAEGQLTNFLGYFLQGNEVLIGNLTMSSNYFDTRPYIPVETTSTTQSTTPLVTDNFQLPDKIDFILSGKFKEMLYQTYDMKQLTGKLHIHNQRIDFEQTSLEMIGGTFGMTGYYDTKEKNNHKADFNLKLKHISIPETYKTFVTVQSFAKAANYIIGLMDANITINSTLGKGYAPNLSTLTSEGDLNIPKAAIQNVPALKIISEKLHLPKLQNLELTNLNPSYIIKDGKFRFKKPLNFKYQGINMNLDGYNSLDKSINYVMSFDLPAKEVNGQAQSAVNNLFKGQNMRLPLNETIKVNAIITGTFDKPSIKLDIKDVAKSIVNSIRDKAKEEINKKVDEAKAKAQAELDKQKQNLEAEKNKAQAKAQEEINKQKQQLDDAKKKAEDDARRQIEEEKAKAKKQAKDQLNGLFGH